MAPPAADQIETLLAFAGQLADAARDAILPHFRAELTVENKSASGFDPVTQADKAAEQAMRQLIEESFPEHGILGEELGQKRSRDGLTWVLDPIDGTRAFVAGLPSWGTLIGLLYDGEPLVGIIDQGHIGERFRGWPGGADLIGPNGVRRQLRARACEGLGAAVVSTTDPQLFSRAEAPGFDAVRSAAKLVRYGYDCYAYAMVALGTIDLVIESGLAPWDVAALAPVIVGAGGRISDWGGAPLSRSGQLLDAGTRMQVLAAGDARCAQAALLKLVPATARTY